MNQENMDLVVQKIISMNLYTDRGPLTEKEIIQLAHELDKFSNTIIDCYLLENKIHKTSTVTTKL